ncbi:hypothetical protein M431DRAFT_511076 [Trichoderma harzianum CBS 226.95]|uniref:Uncharacterized protein n=1 Tax=Trichoderma harzianum CBS 226.95 TaxID=983964 RepID=A0A2T4A4D8_TRIHA|nr:hypothetical protein M431DRAFT_511076 [Trichoderma harzianum CBS 226.95]PTB51929.1 hypothetical protein M431DRAFT_511076 [Trichoderma harzianum CBS 226.95]
MDFFSLLPLGVLPCHPEATVPAAARPRRSRSEFGCCASSVVLQATSVLLAFTPDETINIASKLATSVGHRQYY